MNSRKKAFGYGGVALLLVGGILLLLRNLPKSPPAPSAESKLQNAMFDPPTIVVETSYPGANAHVMSNTVAAPIEHQVNGVEGMVSMRSQCTNAGQYALTVTFKPGTDLNMAQILVQNRVSLAYPVLPVVVQQAGVGVKKKSTSPLIMVALYSPNAQLDEVYLSNYATLQIRDELARLEGVGDVVLFGNRDYEISVQIDPIKLVQFNLTLSEVSAAIKAQNIPIAGGVGKQGKKQFELKLNAFGRLTDADGLRDIILKAAPRDGNLVRLKDVAEISMGSMSGSSVSLDGKRVVGLAIYTLSQPDRSQLSELVQEKMSALAKNFPEGIDWSIPFDFTPNLDAPSSPTTPEYLQVDLQLPDAASTERTQEFVTKCEKMLLSDPGVRHVLSLTGPPMVGGHDRGTILIELVPSEKRQSDREQLAEMLRSQLRQEMREATIHVYDQSGPGRFPLTSYPVEFALCDCGDLGEADLHRVGELLLEKLWKSTKFAEAALGAGSRTQPSFKVDVNRVKALTLGVNTIDISSTLEAFLGNEQINVVNPNGGTKTITITIKNKLQERGIEAQVKNWKVRNGQGQLVPLSSLLTIRSTTTTPELERSNLYPMIRIIGDPAAGVSLSEARTLCESIAQEVLPKGYELRLLRELPSSK